MTGGARGIGEATVRLFVKNGAKVVIADIADASGTALANALSPSAIYVHCDVSLEKDIENLISSTISRHGRLDILFNNAGVLGQQSRAKCRRIRQHHQNQRQRSRIRNKARG